jgi:hypothetical protein
MRIAYHGRSGRVRDIDGLDPGIAPFVEVLWSAGLDTYESCEGGHGHSYPQPAVRFRGGRTEGFWALHVAVQNGLPVAAIRRFWSVDRSGEPTGPYWEMAFRELANPGLRTDGNEVDSPLPAPDVRAICPSRSRTRTGRGTPHDDLVGTPGCSYEKRRSSWRASSRMSTAILSLGNIWHKVRRFYREGTLPDLTDEQVFV